MLSLYLSSMYLPELSLYLSGVYLPELSLYLSGMYLPELLLYLSGVYLPVLSLYLSGMYLPMLSLYLSVCIYLCCHYTNLVCIYLSFYYTFLVFIYLSYHCHHLRLHSVYPCPLPSSSPGRHRGRLHHPNLTYRLCREPYPAINKWQIMLVSNKIHNYMFTVAVSLVRKSNHFFKTCLKKLS